MTVWAATGARCGVSFLINTALGGKRPQFPSALWGPESPAEETVRAGPESVTLSRVGWEQLPPLWMGPAERPKRHPQPTPGFPAWFGPGVDPVFTVSCTLVLGVCDWRSVGNQPFGPTSTFLILPNLGVSCRLRSG